jgi:hypothetical protein
MAREASTNTSQQEAAALAKLVESIALVEAFVASSRLRARKNAIKVRGGRVRARNAPRDERGRFCKNFCASRGRVMASGGSDTARS